MAQAALRLGRRNAQFLLGRLDDARALFSERSLDALFVFQALLLNLRLQLLDLVVQPGQLLFHRAEAGLASSVACARGLQIVAQRLRALAENLGKNPRRAEQRSSRTMTRKLTS